MSNFIGNLGNGDDTILRQTDLDDSLGPWGWSREGSFFTWLRVLMIGAPSWDSGYWPGGSGLIGNQGTDWGMTGITGTATGGLFWEQIEITRGANGRFLVTGVSRDQYGSPIASCTVRLFHTSDNILQDTQTSDASGNFTVSTPYYPDTHYIVAYKSGSPDVEGTTVNTLIGA